MAAMVAWAWHDISTSTSSTAALGILVIPPVLLVVAAATFGVDRAVYSAWRLTHPTQHAPAEPTERPPAIIPYTLARELARPPDGPHDLPWHQDRRLGASAGRHRAADGVSGAVRGARGRLRARLASGRAAVRGARAPVGRRRGPRGRPQRRGAFWWRHRRTTSIRPARNSAGYAMVRMRAVQLPFGAATFT